MSTNGGLCEFLQEMIQPHTQHFPSLSSS